MAGDFIPSFRDIGIIPYDFWGQPVYLDGNGDPQCPGFTGETFAVNLWDYVLIGGRKTPGIATVTAHKFRDLDKKKQKSTDGARLTIHGIEPALVEIKLLIWTPAQLAELNTMWTQVFPLPQKVTTTKTVPDTSKPGPPKTVNTVVGINHDTGKPIINTTTIPTFLNKKVSTTTLGKAAITPFDVDHPIFALHHVRSVVFLSGEGPDPGPVTRSRVFTMKAIEFLQPGKQDAGTTPEASAQQTLFSPGYPTAGSNQSNAGPKAK